MFQLSWGKLRREPATRWFDRSFAPIPKSDERFARQYRYELPPEFPLASPYSGIVHHLSGPNLYAQPQLVSRTSVRVALPDNYFHFARGFATLVLAHKLDSLVRVSRRDGEKQHLWNTIA